MASDWNFPGSKWWKFDFHTHTPASADYVRRNIAPEDWLRSAMESGLDCVVVTDHNSGGWIDALKAKNKALQQSETRANWYRELYIFPGVEIAVADSVGRVHLLAVFDPSCDSQKVTGVLGACGITSGYGDDQHTSTTTGFVDTVNKITEAGGIAIPTHIDRPKGLFDGIKSLTPELEKILDKILTAEFCNVHEFDKAHLSLKRRIEQLAKVAGSDAHKPDDIGKHFCWIKMSSPSIDELRLALQDHQFCIKNQSESPNYFPDFFLSRLTIKCTQYCGRITGQPFIIEFHPLFNAIIGGRGTGKSTVLESIRIVSRREQNLSVEAPGIKDELDKFMRLSRDKGVMLEDSEILLEVHRRGKDYRLRWRFDGQGIVLEEKESNGWQERDAGDINERFPVSIFSQKQIYELASNPRGLLEIIDHAPEVNRTEWLLRWQTAKSRFLQLRERRRELLRQLDGETQLRAKLADVENDLKQYEEKGHGEILKQYQKRSQQKNALPADQIFDDLSLAIRELSSSVELSDFPAHIFDDQDETTAEIRAIHERTTQDLKKIGEELAKIADGVDVLKAERAKKLASSKWGRAVQASIAAYDRLVKEYEEKKSRLSIAVYGEWVQQRNTLQQRLKQLDSVRREVEVTEIQTVESLAGLQALRVELFEKRRIFLEKVIGASAFVRMELVQYGDVSTLEDDYCSLFNLDEGRFVSSVYDRENRQGILWIFKNWENAKIPAADLPQLITQIKAKTLDIAEGHDSGNHGAFDNRLRKLFETQPALFDQLEVWWPEDMLRVKYSKDPSSGKFDDLEKGSAGQKAAAILAFLLSYGDEPLIIDQPEDDLDNALIYELIVKQIRDNKNKRQLIIATHNPNIVVNGDAELVNIMRFKNGQIQIDQQGGIDESNIRDSICTIMEGGKDAFDKRYARIRTEKVSHV